MVKYNNSISNLGDYINFFIHIKYVIYQVGQTQSSCGHRQVYNVHLNIIDRDLAANRPDPVTILDVTS